MEASKLKEILDQHKLWLETNEVQGERANLKDADLYGADLWHANLEGADLRGANLSYANLTRANLTRAKLSGAKLNCANLEAANLTGANLSLANLWGANLWGANLENAYLGGSNLAGANLARANLCGAYLAGANLTGAVGLPNVSWVIPGCLVRLNKNMYGFYLEKEDKLINFIQDSFGFVIQNNEEEGTFDMLLGDRIIRGIPDWVKYTGLKQVATV